MLVLVESGRVPGDLSEALISGLLCLLMYFGHTAVHPSLVDGGDL